jgi:hypothetical protein
VFGIFSCFLLSHLLVVMSPFFRLQALLFELKCSCVGLQSLCSGRATASSGRSVFTSGCTFHAVRFRPQGPFFLVEFCWVHFGSGRMFTAFGCMVQVAYPRARAAGFNFQAFCIPYTRNDEPYTLDPTPSAVHPDPHTHQPLTLKPTPDLSS